MAQPDDTLSGIAGDLEELAGHLSGIGHGLWLLQQEHLVQQEPEPFPDNAGWFFNVLLAAVEERAKQAEALSSRLSGLDKEGA
jgi:hypothetical protein